MALKVYVLESRLSRRRNAAWRAVDLFLERTPALESRKRLDDVYNTTRVYRVRRYVPEVK